MKIAVVGLGIAGMQAALLLEAAGHEVLLFEARDRLGGRLHWVDQGDGIVYEAGGEWIDSDHSRVRSLLQELGLSLESGPSAPRRYYAHGSVATEANLWPEALGDRERFESRARALSQSLRLPPWENLGQDALDQATLSGLIDETARSGIGRWILTATAISDEGDDPDQVGLLGWLCFYRHYLGRQGDEMSSLRLVEGSGELFRRLAARLSATPNLNAELVAVDRSIDRVNLRFRDGRSTEVHEAILTLPPPALAQVIFTPDLDPQHRHAFGASRLSPVIKVCLAFGEPWWEAEGWDGSMQCDLAIQQTWSGGRDGTPVLTCYIGGRAARSLSGWPADRAVERVLEDLTTLFPECRNTFLKGWLHDWPIDHFAGGGFSCVQPGFALNGLKTLREPMGRVHFAGEHTADWIGFIEGALESAERVAAEIGPAATES